MLDKLDILHERCTICSDTLDALGDSKSRCKDCEIDKDIEYIKQTMQKEETYEVK